MLDEQDREAELGPQLPDERHHGDGLVRVHAGGRLVEQEQRRIAAEGAGDLQAALVAVGQVAGHDLAASGEAHQRQQLGRAFSRPNLFFAGLSGAQERVDGIRAELEVHPDHDVLERGHVGEEADVLERPADPGVGHLVGLGTAEDAGPMEQIDVGLRPDDRGQEHPGEHEERDRGTQCGDRRRARGDEQESGQESDHDRWRHPEHRLQPGPDRPADHPPARDPDVAAGRVEDADDDVEEGRLAGPIRPDQADDRPARDLEVDLLDRDEAAERLRHLSGVEDQVRRLRGRRRCRHQSPNAAVGGGTSAMSSLASWSSRWRRRFGKRPSGRSSIIPTRARP